MTDIDREVAEKVMGWHLSGPLPSDYWFSFDGRIPEHYKREWSPSTRIDHAWEVVEQIISRTTMMVSVNYGHGGWWCTIYPEFEHSVEGDYADTAPLAICKAALAAVEKP